jgi:hypothetical protein
MPLALSIVSKTLCSAVLLGWRQGASIVEAVFWRPRSGHALMMDNLADNYAMLGCTSTSKNHRPIVRIDDLPFAE